MNAINLTENHQNKHIYKFLCTKGIVFFIENQLNRQTKISF